MEADINLIIDVDPNEAQSLIHLIELLFEEWYVARETRRERLARILEIDGAKDAAKSAPKELEQQVPAKGSEDA